MLAIIAVVLVLVIVFVILRGPARTNRDEGWTNTGIMRISSQAFVNEGVIPQRYTYDGENISPPLDFTDVPTGTRSLALIMEDPDVPRSVRADGIFDHWLLWNIPPDRAAMPAGDTDTGVVGMNSSGRQGYTGPCPPDREHRYFFKLYALDVMLDIDAGSVSKENLIKAMEGHILEQAVLMGRYDRSR